MQRINAKKVTVFRRDNGSEPYAEWFHQLRDYQAKARIESRLQRLAVGLYGDCEPVGEGVLELRMFFGPGYRVYFGEEGENIVVLLCGGDKSTQRRDIETAKKYWREYKRDA
jgi:putative addiction module killer protein